MAFRAPTNHRHLSIRSLLPFHDDDAQGETGHSPLLSSPVFYSPAVEQDADEWVVFSPSSVGDATTVTGTNPRSRVSEIGSLESAPRILRHGGSYEIPGTFDDLAGDEEEDEDDDDDYLDGTETDSLQPFREQDNEGPVMLPTHDGLGMFPSSSGVITGLRSLEESLRIIAMAEHNQGEEETAAKIIRWRGEHTQAVLDEIEKLTRRRISLASLRGGNLGHREKALLEEDTTSMGTSTEDLKSVASTSTQNQVEETEEGEEHPETLWRRITRRFIRDIMGIDDELLQVIFGEALPAEASVDFLHEENMVARDAEERLLSRLARELGVLVNQYTSHPSGDGAFSTHGESLYEDSDDGSKTPQARSSQAQQDEYTTSPHKRHRSQSLTSTSSSVPQFQFAPTLPQEEASHAALWGIEEEQEVDEETQAKRDSQFRKEYWEQELGVRVFFSFLKSRFSGPPPTPTPPPAPPHQHHPLIRNARPAFHPYQSPVAKRPASVAPAKMAPPSTAPSTSGGQFFGGFGFGIRSGSSYASGGKGKTVSSRGSSRNRGFYWDVATSVGSGKTGSCVSTGVWAAI